MTEAEWNECTDPVELLRFLNGRASPRKLRLLVYAGSLRDQSLAEAVIARPPSSPPWYLPVRKLRFWIDETFSRRRYRMIEELRRSILLEKKCELLLDDRNREDFSRYCQEAGNGNLPARLQLLTATDFGSRSVAAYIQNLADYMEYNLIVEKHGIEISGRASVYKEYVHYLHDLFGPLFFRPVAIDPLWLTSTVAKLAKDIYEEKTFNHLPILADALEEAGCTDPDILKHCRQPGEHVRGCWVIDLLTGGK